MLQFFLVSSYFFGSEDLGGFSDILSFFRPLMLLVIVLSMVVLTEELTQTYDALIGVTKLIVSCVFLYSLLEVFFFDIFSSLMFLFYRMEDKVNIDGISVSFFTLPYYGAYILCMLLPLTFSNYALTKNKAALFYIFACFGSIVLTQSKMGVFLSFGVLFIYAFLSSSFNKKIIVIIISLLFFGILGYFLVDFVSYLNKEVGGNFARTLHLILTNTEQAHNLNERLEDITGTYSKIIEHNPYVGVGLGKGQTIEIWIGTILYRYGFPGLILFILYFLFIGMAATLKLGRLKHGRPKEAELAKTVAIWAFTIFISQLSGFMMEMSKAAVFSMMMLALSARILFGCQLSAFNQNINFSSMKQYVKEDRRNNYCQD
ncbi:hypothetical protein EZV61_05630 [Corallincola luteus]|uniref:O-antigen ligase domain-containing protein n=1 Tax=Corallincola luteus TaxID=1775177 RepID=A0ABY2AQY3_9GAMM|nr:hypothetical protein [Corallincola luteus]TCI05431.1 hypothetical protein EZV61_05630 [Corallincola luteus]